MLFYIKFKLSQRNYPIQHILPNEPLDCTAAGDAGLDDEQTLETHANGTFNGTTPGSPRRHQAASAATMDAVKVALRDTAREFELRYSRAFNDLHSTLHITPATAYQSFENVMDEVFRDGVNWGRIVGLFAFGGALCVECVEKEMSHLVARIVEWMTVYLDEQIEPWVESQGGWVSLIKRHTHTQTAKSHVVSLKNALICWFDYMRKFSSDYHMEDFHVDTFVCGTLLAAIRLENRNKYLLN